MSGLVVALGFVCMVIAIAMSAWIIAALIATTIALIWSFGEMYRRKGLSLYLVPPWVGVGCVWAAYFLN